MALKIVDGVSPSLEVRKEIINALFYVSVGQTGKSSDGVQVQRLANWSLLKDLTDNHPGKVTQKEYPFFMKRQSKIQYHREKADENIPETHTTQKYLPGKTDSSAKGRMNEN